jgi:hypothetical protein
LEQYQQKKKATIHLTTEGDDVATDGEEQHANARASCTLPLIRGSMCLQATTRQRRWKCSVIWIVVTAVFAMNEFHGTQVFVSRRKWSDNKLKKTCVKKHGKTKVLSDLFPKTP